MLSCCARKQKRGQKESPYLGGTLAAACTGAHYLPYVYNAAVATNLKYNWMSHLPNATMLFEVSMPGTHDTTTWNVATAGINQCQCLTVLQQLAYGVRFLDLRVRKSSGDVMLYHGAIGCNVNLRDVFAEVKDFLTHYPTEFIILKFKREKNQLGPVGSGGELVTAINALIATVPATQRHRLHPAGTVGDYRGKMLYVDDIHDDEVLMTDGIYEDELFVHCDREHTDIDACTQLSNYKDSNYARQLENITKMINLHNLTCTTSAGVVRTPHLMFSAGWNINTGLTSEPVLHAMEMHPRALTLLNTTIPANFRVGIQMFDFITPDLVNAVIRHNPAVKTALHLA